MNNYFKKSVDLIVKNTNLNEHYATINLINVESMIQTEELSINNCKFNQSYFYLASAKIINKYKKYLSRHK